MTLFKILFWASLATQIYVFLGFIVILWLFSKFKQRPVLKSDVTPSISVIICAFNEEKHIRQKIANCQEFDYPKDRMEIIAISDGSGDGTYRILEEMQSSLINVYRMPTQQGKTACQNFAATVANNEVLFFTDATVMHPPHALRLLVRSLNDPSVGCVTGKPVFKKDSGPVSKGLSKRDSYEFYLRDKLAAVATLFGAQDCMYVIPRALYTPVRPDLDGGFVGPLQLLERGYRTVYEPEALAFVNRRAPNLTDEFSRRSRIALRGMRGLLHMRHLMNPFRYGFVAVALISTRLLRWLTPLFLIVTFVSNLILAASSFYLFTLLLQVAFYATALFAFLIVQNGSRLVFPFYVPLYFCVLACSALIGLKRLLAGESGQVWQTRR